MGRGPLYPCASDFISNISNDPFCKQLRQVGNIADVSKKKRKDISTNDQRETPLPIRFFWEMTPYTRWDSGVFGRQFQ